MTTSELGVGIIGTGIWGANHAQAFTTLPNTRVVAVCDIAEERARELAAAYGVGSVYADYRKLLENPAVEAVAIATPDFSHTDIILDAIKAVKHVLSEKPLATTLVEAQKISDAVKGTDRVVTVDFANRASPVFAAARADIAAGSIGKPVHANGRLSNTTWVPLEMLSWSARSSALWFLGSHLVDLLRYMFDDDVVRVFALKRNGVLKSLGVDTADVHLAMLEFAKGTIATIENSWILSPSNPQVFDLNVRIVGDGGQLDLNPSHNSAYVQLGGNGMKYKDLLGAVPVGGGRIGGFVFEALARFVDTVTTGAPLLATVEDGLKATRVLSAIEESAATGKPVDVSQ